MGGGVDAMAQYKRGGHTVSVWDGWTHIFKQRTDSRKFHGATESRMNCTFVYLRPLNYINKI